MADFAVSTSFRAQDKLSKSFRDMERGAGRFGRGASRSFRDASKSASRFRDVTKGILAAGAVSRSLSALTMGLRGTTAQFVSFDDSITAAAAKFIDVNLATKQGQRSFEALRRAARKTGAATEFSATQAAAALDFLAMAGFNSEQAMASLPGVVNLATAGNLDLATASDIASDALGALGLMTKDTAQLQKNLTRVNDVFARTATTANVTVQQLFESVRKGAPDFTNAGQSLETFAAMAGTMAGSGIKAEEAGTQLRNSIVRLSAATPLAQSALRMLGVSVEDSNGKFRDVIDIFEDLQKGLKGVTSDTKRTAMITAIFGVRSAGLKVLLSSNIDKMREYRKTLIDSSGAAQEMADIMRKSLGNQLKALQSAAIELGFKIFEAFKVRGEGGIQALTEAIRKFDPTPIIKGIEGVIVTVRTLWSIVGPMLSVWVKWIQFLGRSAAVIVGFFEGIFGAIMKIPNGIRLITQKIDRMVGDILAPIFKGILKVTDFLGIGPEEDIQARRAQPEQRQAPNQEEAAARREIGFEGRINIAGAPKGTTVEGKTTGAPDINMELLGAS